MMNKDDCFIPNFCHVKTLLVTLLGSEVLVFLLVLMTYGQVDGWTQLIQTSLLVQWITLLSAAAMCLLRGRLQPLSDGKRVGVIFAIIQFNTALVSLGALYAKYRFSMGTFWLIPDWAPFLIRNITISSMVSTVFLHYLYAQHRWRERLISEAQARAEALQARIRPHFLFNTLNTIASLISTRPEVAEQAIEDLSMLFRASLKDFKELVRLEDEIDLCQQYLNIESLRLGQRLEVTWDINPDLLSIKIPLLTLQPLIENAVYYGVQPCEEGGLIHIKLTKEQGAAMIVIENAYKASFNLRDSQGQQMAQENIRQRLQTYFGGQASLICHQAGDLYQAIVRVPLNHRWMSP